MENEILEYIDDVRTEYPEVVAEDESIIIQSNPDIEESYIYQEPERSLLEISENKIENINEFKSMGVINNANESDVFVLNSNVSNNRASSENVNLDIFDVTVLWSNSNDNVSFSGQPVALNDNMSNYDFLLFSFRAIKDSNYYTSIIIPYDQFKDSGSGNYDIAFGNYYLKARRILYDNDTEVGFGSALNIYSSGYSDDCVIPSRILGLKSKTLSNNNINNNPIVSGNVINNNYYICCSVSDNSVSNNIMTKNINDYTVGESLSLMIFLGLLVAGMVYTIKKSIFKW